MKKDKNEQNKVFLVEYLLDSIDGEFTQTSEIYSTEKGAIAGMEAKVKSLIESESKYNVCYKESDEISLIDTEDNSFHIYLTPKEVLN